MVTPIHSESALTWEPVIDPRRAYRTDEPCPDCGQTLAAGPCGTWRVCTLCRRLVVPAAVSAPYARTGSAREVRSQRDRDLEAIALARRKGVMLGQLGQLAEDKRLDPASAPVLDWLDDQVRAATSGARLDELAELAADPAAGIRRRHWWQSGPAALPAPHAGQGDIDDQDDEENDGGELPGAQAPPRLAAPSPAAAGVPLRLTWADSIATYGWRLSPVVGGCQILDHGQLCGAQTTAAAGDGWVCSEHHAALVAVIIRAARRS